nr:MAG TPA: hypothetical protein [Caudoviricetes sp.]DAT89992.1 MAG TPA: hypothetical protein [Caudoviricetes sp.]
MLQRYRIYLILAIFSCLKSVNQKPKMLAIFVIH